MSEKPSQHASILTSPGPAQVTGRATPPATNTINHSSNGSSNSSGIVAKSSTIAPAPVKDPSPLQNSITIVGGHTSGAPALEADEEGSAPLAKVSPTSLGSVVSPVLSRDFASELDASSVKALGRRATENDAAKPKSTTGHPGLEGGEKEVEGATSTSTNPAGPANPRLRALKNLVRANSEPVHPSHNHALGPADINDPEKGALARGTADVPPPARPPVTFSGLLEPKKPLRPPPTWKTSFMNIVKFSWLNVLLVFIPVSFAVHFAGVSDTAIFCCSFAAIIPLAALLGLATEEMAIRVGPTIGGLMNATLGNLVELIIAILALAKGELRVVQSSMIGSILSNCLLVLGCCFFAGGIRFHEQIYTIRAAQLNTSMLGISALVIVIPAAFHAAVSEIGDAEAQLSEGDIIKLSRGVAFILLFVYVAYLFFQLWTHSYLYSPKGVVPKRSTLHRSRTITDADAEPQPPHEGNVLRMPSWHSSSSSSSSEDGGGEDGTASSSSSSSASSDDEEHETPKLKIKAALILILCISGLTGVIAEYLVDSIDGMTANGGISKEFVALILLPLVGNAAEHVTAVMVSVKDKLDLSLAVAVGSSIQISLFVLPLLILLGWCIGQPLTLQFDILETITLFISIVIVNQAISDGLATWLEGLALMVCYLIIAVTFYFYPGSGFE